MIYTAYIIFCSLIFFGFMLILWKKIIPKIDQKYKEIYLIFISFIYFIAIFLYPLIFNIKETDSINKNSGKNNNYHYAEIKPSRKEIHAIAGNKVLLPVKLINKSGYDWDSKLKGTFTSYHLLGQNKNIVDFDNEWIPFPHPVRRGADIDLNLIVDVPDLKGIYYIHIDLIQRRVKWFSKDLKLKDYMLVKLNVL